MYVIITVTKEVFKFKDIKFITSMYVSIISIYCYKYILLVYFFIIQQLLLNKNHCRLWFFSLSKTVRLLIIAYIHFIWTCVYIFCTFNTLWLVWRVVSLSLKSHLLISILWITVKLSKRMLASGTQMSCVGLTNYLFKACYCLKIKLKKNHLKQTKTHSNH